MKKQISKKLAKEKYQIAVMPHHDYKYYLLDDGRVIDSDGDTRFIPPHLCGICYQPEDPDGRCACTNKDAC